MSRPHTQIQRKLMAMILFTSGAVLLLTCVAFFAYEFLTFRQSAIRQLATLGNIVATNSTAALAFDNQDDAADMLKALKAEHHIEVAALYDKAGRLFATFPAHVAAGKVPFIPGPDGNRVTFTALTSVLPVIQGDNKRLGTLYIRSDMGAIYARMRLYGMIAAMVIVAAGLLAYVLSRRLQQDISRPILALADAATAISDRRDYSVRAAKFGDDELGRLTDAFNQMLSQIQSHTEESATAAAKLHAQVARLALLNRITRAIGERQDLPSIFGVILHNLEDNVPIDFTAICLYSPFTESLTVTAVGAQSRKVAEALDMMEEMRVPIDQNGLSRCVQGTLVYEPDVRQIPFPFAKRLASGGLRSLVAAPLVVEGKVFAVLLAARRVANGYDSGECEFLRQLSEHVALAAHQAKLYGALQQAYDDLRQSQQTVMQQERLRALGEMASGIAHDINNAISPAMLYIDALLEQETGMTARAREYLGTIQRAIEDVTQTVARMREFYRPREPQLALGPIDLNRMVQHVVDLTRVRWRDVPQERGIVIQLDTQLAEDLPIVMGAEGEIRDALTNLIFNAVDAMTSGGTLTIRTHTVSDAGTETEVRVEVSDTGDGMSEETKRRCLEPFFTTKGERGTGLGLAMVYGMVQRHSAGIEIDSTLGAGTTIRLLFPVSTDIVLTATPAASARPGQPLRLLVVDDDPLLLKTLCSILEGDGHIVTPANGGQAGIDAFEAATRRGAPFTVVITDLGMPYVDGRRVATAVKSMTPSTPVLLLTGWGQRMQAEHDMPPDVDRLLSKPPKLQDLRAVLAEVTRG